jgi:hypothetical protein
MTANNVTEFKGRGRNSSRGSLVIYIFFIVKGNRIGDFLQMCINNFLIHLGWISFAINPVHPV